MKVLVTGSSGLIATALIASLAERGHDVVRLLRHPGNPGVPSWDPDRGTLDLAGVRDIEAVVHLAGESIADGRWTVAKKARILDSRVKGTTLLANGLAALASPPRVFISASAVGYYGERGDELLDEAGACGNDFLSDVCRQWEHATGPAAGAGVRVVNLRLGVILSAAGGALAKMLTPFRMGVGGVVGSGRQYMSWVSLEDVVAAIHFLMMNEALRGPVNCVSPNPVSNREFTATLGRMLHRPTIFPLPAFAARLALGEMADALLLTSIRAVPRKLLDGGYAFRHPQLAEALEAELRLTPTAAQP